MTAARRRFSQEFKDELCLEVISASKTIKEVAVANDVGPETELTLTERARLKELEQVVQDLRAETASLNRASGCFAREQRLWAGEQGSCLQNVCVATVSTSGIHHWLVRAQSAAAARRGALTTRVRRFFEASDGTYGYRRIHADLADEDTECSPELVRQIMGDQGLVACQPRPFRVTTQSDAQAAEAKSKRVSVSRSGIPGCSTTPKSSMGDPSESQTTSR